MGQKEQIVVGIADRSENSNLIRKWQNRFFRDEEGNSINNLSHHVRSAIIRYAYPHLKIPVDPRFVIGPDDMPDKDVIDDSPEHNERANGINDTLDAL